MCLSTAADGLGRAVITMLMFSSLLKAAAGRDILYLYLFVIPSVSVVLTPRKCKWNSGTLYSGNHDPHTMLP